MADSEAFLHGELIIYHGAPDDYELARAMETTDECGAGKAGGALAARLEDGKIVDLDCDNFSGIDRLLWEDRVFQGASPKLRAELEERRIEAEAYPAARLANLSRSLLL